jgi:hypothetical protein
MADDLARQFEQSLVGQPCAVTRREHDWVFDFSDGRSVTVEAVWRLVSSTAILLTNGDDGQRFGLPAPVDAQQKANALLAETLVERARIEAVTSDLVVWVANGLRLDILNNSSGYEGWQGGAGKILVVAQGGGNLTVF